MVLVFWGLIYSKKTEVYLLYFFGVELIVQKGVSAWKINEKGVKIRWYFDFDECFLNNWCKAKKSSPLQEHDFKVK